MSSPSPSLDRRSSGILLGALFAADEALRVFEHLRGGAKDCCQHELEALACVPRDTRLARMRELVGQLLAPAPQRVALIHPSWFAHELERIHPAVAAAVVDVLPSSLARELASFAGVCGLSMASRLRLVQDVLHPFEGIDGSSLAEGYLERWIVGGTAFFFTSLERLAVDSSAPKEALGHALTGLEAKTRPWAMGGVMVLEALNALDASRASQRFLWRLPRDIACWIEEMRVSVTPDIRWSRALAAILEKFS